MQGECGDSGCPGWKIFNTGGGDAVQRCDACETLVDDYAAIKMAEISGLVVDSDGFIFGKKDDLLRMFDVEKRLHAAQDAIITLTTTCGAPNPDVIYSKYPGGVRFMDGNVDWQAIYDAHKNRGSIE